WRPPGSGVSSIALHDALPISALLGPPRLAVRFPLWICAGSSDARSWRDVLRSALVVRVVPAIVQPVVSVVCAKLSTKTRDSRLRSEEHTSELQSREKLVCRLL